jgi:hypothetical protein
MRTIFEIRQTHEMKIQKIKTNLTSIIRHQVVEHILHRFDQTFLVRRPLIGQFNAGLVQKRLGHLVEFLVARPHPLISGLHHSVRHCLAFECTEKHRKKEAQTRSTWSDLYVLQLSIGLAQLMYLLQFFVFLFAHLAKTFVRHFELL